MILYHRLRIYVLNLTLYKIPFQKKNLRLLIILLTYNNQYNIYHYAHKNSLRNYKTTFYGKLYTYYTRIRIHKNV